MIKSRKGKVTIKGNGGQIILDLCGAAVGVRDTIAEDIDSEKEASKFLLSIIAHALNVKVEFENAGDTDA